MTTPNDNTPLAIITDALGPQGAGLLQEGQEPNPEQIVSGMRTLTEMINLWQTQGLKLWLNVDTEITLVSGTGTYTLGPSGTVNMTRPLRVIDAYYLDSSDVRRPLTPLSWSDYIRLSQVTQTGSINSYFVDKQQAALSVSFWLVPDTTAATGAAHLLLQTQVGNPINLTETMNFPVEWRIALRWGLADESCGGQPQAIMDRCATKALMYKTMLEDWDVEDAPVRFTPDSRGQYFSSKFR